MDLAALAFRRIVAAHNRGQNAQAVAEHVLMSAMYLLRDMGDAHEMGVCVDRMMAPVGLPDP